MDDVGWASVVITQGHCLDQGNEIFRIRLCPKTGWTLVSTNLDRY